MREIRNLAHRQIEKRLQSFLRAQTAVFQNYRHLSDWCRESLVGENDQASYETAKLAFKDVVKFEGQFDDFEIEFWNYVGDIDSTRAIVDNYVTRNGFTDHKEYFFSKIELCVSTLNDVITEVRAANLDLPFLGNLEESLEKLFDEAEDLIEIDLGQLREGELAELLRQIPAQRTAPLEVIATSRSIARKIGPRFVSRVDDSSIRQAADALHEVLNDTYLELNSSNCDPRVLKALAKCVLEISQDVAVFSPIKFGIYVGVMNGFREAIKDELGAITSMQIISALMQCDLFLRNFDDWQLYSQESSKLSDEDSMTVLDDFLESANHPLFETEVREALAELRVDKKDFGESRKIDYAIFQSVGNALSEVCRQGLRYMSSAPGKVATILRDTISDGVKFIVGTLALTWIIGNSAYLTALSEQYSFFSWIKPVVDFIVHSAG